jgi:hypothetical protein
MEMDWQWHIWNASFWNLFINIGMGAIRIVFRKNLKEKFLEEITEKLMEKN